MDVGIAGKIPVDGYSRWIVHEEIRIVPAEQSAREDRPEMGFRRLARYTIEQARAHVYEPEFQSTAVGEYFL
jgi:hypothetical protein